MSYLITGASCWMSTALCVWEKGAASPFVELSLGATAALAMNFLLAKAISERGA